MLASRFPVKSPSDAAIIGRGPGRRAAALGGNSVVGTKKLSFVNEPVVCRPEEAIDCFLRTKMDVLVLGDTLIRR